jgi:aspartokinase
MKNMALILVSEIRSLNVVASILNELDELRPDDNPVAVALLFRNEIALATNENRCDKVVQVARRIAAEVSVNVRKDLSLVAVIGGHFQQSRVYENLRKAGVEPMVVIKTPSGVATCVIVEQTETDTSIRALHDGLLAS